MRMRSASYPVNKCAASPAVAPAAAVSCAASPTKRPLTATRVPKFLRCLYDILHNEDQTILSWSKDGMHFQIYNTAKLELEILPKYFKHGKFASFQRQLNNFGFRKWTKTQSNVCTFSHHHYVRRHPQQLVELVVSHNESVADANASAERPQPLGVHNGKRKRSDSACESSKTTVKATKREPQSYANQRPAALNKADAFDFEVEAWSVMADISPLEWASKSHLSHIKTESGNETPTSTAGFADIAFDFSADELDDILLAGSALDGGEDQIFDMRLVQDCYATAQPAEIASGWNEGPEVFGKAELEMYMQDTELWAGH